MTAFAPRFTITNAITADLTAIERARGFLDAATLSEEWVRRMCQRALLLEAHYTTHLEGTQLTLEQAARLWAGGAVEHAKPDDIRELLNYRDAFDVVSRSLTTDEPISEDVIRAIHAKLVEGVRGGEGGPGSYRSAQNRIVNIRTRAVVYTPPPPQEVAPLMRELVDWLRADTTIHPVLVAAIAQFQLVHVHPFVDGNGRTSRLLSTLCLYRAGYDFKRLFTISEFYDRDRRAFYNAIQAVRERDMDLTGWIEFFTHGLATQLGEVKARGERVIKSDIVARTHGLSARQALVVEHLFGAAKVRAEDLEVLVPEINRRTLQRDLQDLVEKGIVKTSGAARAIRYALGIKNL